jgi:hypothetical protein
VALGHHLGADQDVGLAVADLLEQGVPLAAGARGVPVDAQHAGGEALARVSSRRWVPRPKGWMSWSPQSGQASGMPASKLQWWQRRRRSARCSTMLAVQCGQRLTQPQDGHDSTGA